MMNKKEQAAFEEAKNNLAAAMALSWPTEPEPKPINVAAAFEKEGEAPFEWNMGGRYAGHTERLLLGWYFHTYQGSFRVTKGCTTRVYHNSSSTDKTSTQQPGRLYLTRDEAHLAARWEMCREFGKALADLDHSRRTPSEL